MTPRVAAWGGVCTALGVTDFLLNRKHDGSTFSEVTRFVFRTHHPVGRVVFTAVLVGGGVAFHQHICKAGSHFPPS